MSEVEVISIKGTRPQDLEQHILDNRVQLQRYQVIAVVCGGNWFNQRVKNGVIRPSCSPFRVSNFKFHTDCLVRDSSLISHAIFFQAYRLPMDLANSLMSLSSGRIIVIGVPLHLDGTNEYIKTLNSLLTLDRRCGYKYLGRGYTHSNTSVLAEDKVHLNVAG